MTTVADAAQMPEKFGHVRIIVGMVLGLSLARLVNGMAGFIQHPRRRHIYLIHFGWVLYLLSAIIHFWWFEFELYYVHAWTFGIYLYVLVYAILYVAAAALLFPEKMEEYSGFAEYFESRRRWFYGLLVVIFAIDIGDSLIKGIDYFYALGPIYCARQFLLIIGAFIAIFVGNKKYQLSLVTIVLITQFAWIFHQYDILQ